MQHSSALCSKLALALLTVTVELVNVLKLTSQMHSFLPIIRKLHASTQPGSNFLSIVHLMMASLKETYSARITARGECF
jgi:hypothetical protein